VRCGEGAGGADACSAEDPGSGAEADTPSKFSAEAEADLTSWSVRDTCAPDEPETAIVGCRCGRQEENGAGDTSSIMPC
jgi:hypothetical protein